VCPKSDVIVIFVVAIIIIIIIIMIIIIIVIIIIIMGKTALFEPWTSLENSATFVLSWELDQPVFTSLDFETTVTLQSKVVQYPTGRTRQQWRLNLKNSLRGHL
jgi:hypothetical protein